MRRCCGAGPVAWRMSFASLHLPPFHDGRGGHEQWAMMLRQSTARNKHPSKDDDALPSRHTDEEVVTVIVYGRRLRAMMRQHHGIPAASVTRVVCVTRVSCARHAAAPRHPCGALRALVVRDAVRRGGVVVVVDCGGGRVVSHTCVCQSRQSRVACARHACVMCASRVCHVREAGGGGRRTSGVRDTASCREPVSEQATLSLSS